MTIYAYPSLQDVGRLEHKAGGTSSPGMTLKDWFAGQVIAAMVASDSSFAGMRDKNGQHCEIDKAKLNNMAKNSYQAAEAMMHARAATKDVDSHERPPARTH
ncbi:MAG: hypothetical protein K8U03_25755 [Planctomycetia bacterium]|nr:hypothetical protein [Planctomycetia bacterium]